MRDRILVGFLSFAVAGVAFGAWYDRPTVTGRLPVGHDDGGVIQPHYMNMSEDGAYLLVDLASGGNAAKRAAQPALLVRTSDFTLLGEAFATGDFDSGSAGWKGGAISSTLGLMIPGNGGETGAKYTSFDVPAESWTAGENAFALTGLADAGTDGLDFNADGTQLFVNQYASGSRNKILVYDTAALKTKHSLSLLTTRTFADINVNRIRNLSCYAIGGKDLVYFGEGENALGDKSVYVWDPSDDSVTALIDNDAALIDGDVMNVKVSGTTTASPKLYVLFDTGVIRIFTLAADGKSLASQTPVRGFTLQEVNELLGVACASTQYRNFEVSDDGETAYMILRGNNLDLCRIEGTTAPIIVRKDGDKFVVTLNGVTATNSLWAAWDATDKGGSTNGWSNVVRVQTVTPETGSVEYDVPSGGTDVKAIRFFLSEVPYDVDYTLAYLQNNKNNRICLDDFDFYGTYRVVMKVHRVSYSNGSPAFFSTRAGCASSAESTPYFTLFEASGNSWRFDYNATVGTGINKPAIGDNDYLIDASHAALKVNGTDVASCKGTFTTDKMRGRLEFFCANYTASAMGNQNHVLRVYSAQIYDYLDSSGIVKVNPTLLVNLVPAVKGGVVGVYDSVRNKFYANDTGAANDFTEQPDTRIESENPFFASGVYDEVTTTGPTEFSQSVMTVDSHDYVNPNGGIQKGTAPIKLTGKNDWGGTFTVEKGTLVAGRGQGLGVNDHIVLSGSQRAAYGGWNGVVVNRLGTGAGEIELTGSQKNLGFSAVDGDLTVNLGGASVPETIEFNSDVRRLVLNNDGSGLCTGTLHFLNPISCPGASAITVVLRNQQGEARLEGNFSGQTSASKGTTLGCYGDATDPEGRFVFAGAENQFKTIQIYGGCYAFEGGATSYGGSFNMYAGVCQVSNATVTATGEAGYASGITVLTNGVLEILDGAQVKVSQLLIGNENNNTAQRAAVSISGKLELDAAISSSAYGSMTINGCAASRALSIEEGADVSCVNCNFYRRNIYMNGGKMTLTGGIGFNKVGLHGVARLNLNGGEINAFGFAQASPEDSGAVASSVAQFVFNGGTLVNGAVGAAHAPHFFQNLEGESGDNHSGVYVTGNGGEFRANNNTHFDYPIATYSFASGDKWKTTGDYLADKAFKKTGPGALYMWGTNTYDCATDVAEGSLILMAEGVGFKSTSVLRVTGGTLDLGGNNQTLKAFVVTAGAVKNGTITATEGVSFYPGGRGTVGTFACDATIVTESGTLTIDVDETGAADSILTTTALDLSNIDLVISTPTTAPEVLRRLKIVTGPYTGEFKSVSGLPAGWTIRYTGGRVSIGPDIGTAIFLR